MKIAIIVSSARAWGWHKDLADSLSLLQHSVMIFSAPSAPYAWPLRLLFVLERIFFRNRPIAIPLDLSSLPGAVREIRETDVDHYDCIINLTPRPLFPLANNVLSLSYDGEMGDIFLLGRLLKRGCPLIAVTKTGAKTPVLTSFAAIRAKEPLLEALASSFVRCKRLLIRVVSSFEAASGPAPGVYESVNRPSAKASFYAVFCFARKYFQQKLARSLFGRTRPHWQLAIRKHRFSELGPPDPTGFEPVNMPLDAYYADPFLYQHEGVTYLFVEKFSYSTLRGTLAYTRLDNSGRPGKFQVIMDCPYHLSYPQLFAHEESIFMIPETGQSNRIELWRARNFPNTWALESVLIENIEIYDSTLLEHNGLWWLFGSVSEFQGSTQDELFAYYSTSLFGPWIPHARNPLKSDVRSARPAGRFVRRNGRLFRPAQDCEAGYGDGLVWCEVTALSPTEYSEKVIMRWTGTDVGGYSGVHTYSESESFDCIDLKSAIQLTSILTQ